MSQVLSCRKMVQNGHRKGFTLIELLVVISIIGVLAAILFPVFARARENARRASCMSNVKQIALGIMMYTQDYDEHYPPSGPYQNGPANPGVIYDGAWMYNPQTVPGTPGKAFKTMSLTGVMSWMDMIFPYVKSVQVFQCPSQPTDSISSYGYSGAIGGYDTAFYNRPAESAGIPITLADVQRPAGTAMLVDEHYKNNISNIAVAFAAHSADEPNSFSPHFQGTNLAFCDGHVKWMKTTLIVGPYTDWSKLWNPSPSHNKPPIAYANPIWNPFVD